VQRSAPNLTDPIDGADFGLIGDGATDNSAAFTRLFAAGAGGAIRIRRGTYRTGKFAILSNTLLYLEPGTVLLDSGVLGVNDRFINISSEDGLAPIQNVTIIGWGTTIRLVKANYGTGEQRHAFHIAGAVENIYIEGLAVQDSGGDAFCVGGVGGGSELTPVNVRIRYCVCDNSRRNAASITAGRGVSLEYCLFANTIGTSPQKGVDVEPDSDGMGRMVGDLHDIRIIGCRSANNRGAGFGYVNPYSLDGKIVSVSFRDCVDVASNTNFAMESARNGGENATVTWDNCFGINAATNGFDHSGSSTSCLVDGMRIHDANQSGQASDRYGSSYSIYSVNGPDGTTYGNLRIRNSWALGTSARKAVAQQLIGEPHSKYRDVDIEVNSDHVAKKRAFYSLTSRQIVGRNRVVFTDETELASTVSIGSGMTAYLNDLITNAGASAPISLSLADRATRLPGVRVRARVKEPERMELIPGPGWTIGGGARLFSNTVGSEVTVEAQPIAADGSTGTWRIVAGGEGWSVIRSRSTTPVRPSSPTG
jgi:hypothetical protein